MSNLTINAGITITNSGSLNFNGAMPAHSSDTLSDSGVLVNHGTVVLHGGLPASGKSAGAAGTNPVGNGAVGLISAGGLLTNAGVLEISDGNGGPASLTTAQGAKLQQTTQGMLSVASNATLTIAGTLASAGTVDVSATNPSSTASNLPGLLQVTATGSATNSGLITLEGGPGSYPGSGHSATPGGTLSDSGVLTNSGTISVRSGGASEGFGSGAAAGVGALLSVTASGSLTNQGLVEVQGGPLGNYRSTANAGLVKVAGVLTNNGQLLLDGGQANSMSASPGGQLIVYGSGKLINTGTITVTGAPTATAPHLSGAAVTLSTGSMLSDSGLLAIEAASVAGGPSGSLTVSAGATLALTGNLLDNGYVLVSGLLVDDGALNGSGNLRIGGTLATIANTQITVSVGQILNDGTIAVASNSTLQVTRAILTDPKCSGTITAGTGSTVTFGNYVAATQTLAFAPIASPGGSVAIAAPQAFHATISGFLAGDQIDVEHVVANQAVFANGTLSLDEVTGTQSSVGATLRFAGAYTTAAFALHADGHGGTSVTTTVT